MRTATRLLANESWPELSRFLCDRIGVGILPWALKEACEQEVNRPNYWDDDTVVMWLRNRIEKYGVFEGGKNSPQLPSGVILHVGFVSIEENEDHWFRLWTSSLSDEQEKISVARSKIADSLYKLRPIDRVASWVLKIEEQLDAREAQKQLSVA